MLSSLHDSLCGIQTASSLLCCKCNRSNSYSAYSQLTKIKCAVSSTWTIPITGDDGQICTSSWISTLLCRSPIRHRNTQPGTTSNTTPLSDTERIFFGSSRTFSLSYLLMVHLTTPYHPLGHLRLSFWSQTKPKYSSPIG